MVRVENNIFCSEIFKIWSNFGNRSRKNIVLHSHKYEENHFNSIYWVAFF